MYSIFISLIGIFIIFLAPTLMLVMWNNEKISTIKPKKEAPLVLTREMIVHKDTKLVKEFKELS